MLHQLVEEVGEGEVQGVSAESHVAAVAPLQDEEGLLRRGAREARRGARCDEWEEQPACHPGAAPGASIEVRRCIDGARGQRFVFSVKSVGARHRKSIVARRDVRFRPVLATCQSLAMPGRDVTAKRGT